VGSWTFPKDGKFIDFVNETKHRIDTMIFSKTRKTETCWIWEGFVHHGGYSRVSTTWRGCKFQFRVHRYMWTLENQIDPGIFIICHACDNPICVNPEHLFLGTHADNAKDKVKKGRVPTVIGRVKLSFDIAEKIRKDRQENGTTYKVFCERYNISKGHVSDIINNRIWTEEVHVGA
jgi:hypothetical protein